MRAPGSEFLTGGRPRKKMDSSTTSLKNGVFELLYDISTNVLDTCDITPFSQIMADHDSWQ